ncbi:hypothetical protein P7C73_g5618, partial [Tremellales sp. Uapishka_1]
MSSRLVPALLAGGVGVIGGIYIWQMPLQELSGKTPGPVPTEGRSQSHKDNKHNDGTMATQSPHPSLAYGGASPIKNDSPTVAGTTAAGRRGNSGDTDAKMRSNPKEQDGSEGGGNGLAEMRERKMEGRGLPSPQGGDTPAKPVAARMAEGEGGGIKKKENGRWWLGGW